VGYVLGTWNVKWVRLTWDIIKRRVLVIEEVHNRVLQNQLIKC
jgi:hypothetical protein